MVRLRKHSKLTAVFGVGSNFTFFSSSSNGSNASFSWIPITRSLGPQPSTLPGVRRAPGDGVDALCSTFCILLYPFVVTEYNQ